MTMSTDPHRNGVDTASLFATLDAVKGDNEIAKFQFRATNSWVSGTHSRSTIDGFYGAMQEMAHVQPFELEADHPAALAPGRRPRTTLTPSFALRDGRPYMAFGTPGGDQQDQWSLTVFLRHVHHGMNLQEAIDAPSFYTDHLPSSFYPREWDPGHLAVEDHFPKRGERHHLMDHVDFDHLTELPRSCCVGGLKPGRPTAAALIPEIRDRNLIILDRHQRASILGLFQHLCKAGIAGVKVYRR